MAELPKDSNLGKFGYFFLKRSLSGVNSESGLSEKKILGMFSMNILTKKGRGGKYEQAN